jgi:hypothetical protein
MSQNQNTDAKPDSINNNGNKIGGGDSAADDSDSDFLNEQLTGNIHKVAIVPPSYTGKPRKSHLIFDACFECGNLGRVDYISDYEYDLFIRPDTCNPRFRIWFNFTVENVKSEQVNVFFSIRQFMTQEENQINLIKFQSCSYFCLKLDLYFMLHKIHAYRVSKHLDNTQNGTRLS